MRRRFARLHDQIDRATGHRRWILPLLCVATFLAAFVGGLLLLA
ncbi:hypothetical protein [Phenylobacterium sp.]|nr:hypothetical protein [Phenylobacterium sp.]